MISLTRVGSKDDPEVGRIKAALHGKTYMDLRVLVCPAGGEFEVGVVSDTYSNEDALGMALMVLCSNLRDPA